MERAHVNPFLAPTFAHFSVIKFLKGVDVSQWTVNFEAHAFNSQWARVKGAVDACKADDPAVVQNIEEFSRLKKVVAYIDHALRGVDPELLPLNFWDPIRDQMSACADQLGNFNSNKAQPHLRAANQHLDAILAQVRPQMLAKGRLGPALQSAAKAYAAAMQEATIALNESTSQNLSQISASCRRASDLLSEVEGNASEINDKHDELLIDTDDRDSTFTELQREIDEIKSFYKKLVVSSGENPSIREEISVAREVSLKGRDEINTIRSSAASTIKDLADFETRILGSVTEDGKREGGFKDELENRLKNLAAFEDQQQKRYHAINEKIESLLPGATSAGLASAYKQMKDSFLSPIKSANRVFYLSIAALVTLSLVVNIESAGLWYLNFVHLSDWPSIGRSVAHKLPFYIPLVWLAYYSSKRRSEFQRLEQEYAHKEALAKSYDSYKKQIEDLGAENDDLMRDLLAKAVDAIAFNASTSLDGRHGDKIPIQEAVEKAIVAAVKVMAKEKVLASKSLGE